MQIRLTQSGRTRDSLLMPLSDDNIDLMLQYRIQLVRCEPTSHFNVLGTRCSGNGKLHDEFGLFNLDPWTDAEWDQYRAQIVGVITRYWDEKFELTPNKPWYPTGAQRTPVPSTITCSLSLAIQDSAAGAHHRYFIIKPRETNFRSFASPENRLGLFTHRDLSLRWITRKTRMGRVKHSVSFLQNTVLHEFGHTLGLNHVNGDGNSDANYGLTLEQREDLMGMGDHLTARHARPWKSQLQRHLVPGHDRQVAGLSFSARVTAPQLITYWDNDWTPPTP